MNPIIAAAIMHERVRDLEATATAARRVRQARRARHGGPTRRAAEAR